MFGVGCAGFNDPKLGDSLFFLHLLWSVEPRVLNWKLVTDGASPNDRILNARYCYDEHRTQHSTAHSTVQRTAQ